MTNGIPTPEFTPTPRPRRSSIGQAAMSSQNDVNPAEDSPSAPAPPPATSGEGESSAAAPSGKPEGARPTPAAPQRARAAGRNGGPARAARSTAVIAEAPTKRMVGSKDILLSVPEELKERMVNTIKWSYPHTGIGQQQKFIRKAIADLCERLENEYNQGEPFPESAVHDE